MAFVANGDLPHLAYAAATVGLRTVPLSLRFRISESVSRLLGALWYRLDRAGARSARQNMQTLLGERLTAAQIEAEIRAHFYVVAFGKVINDMLPELSLDQFNQFLRLEGEAHLKKALAEERGVLLLGTHFGLHGYIPLMLFKRLGYPFVAVLGHEYPSDTWVYRRLVYPIRSRNWTQVPIINADGTPQRELIACLQRKQIMMIWPDLVNDDLFRHPPPNVLPTPFLGHRMLMRTGAFRLAQWLDVPALPFFIVPRKRGFAMVVEPPLKVNRDKSIEALAANLAAYTTRYEPYLLRYPGLWWQWRQKRFSELIRPVAEVAASR